VMIIIPTVLITIFMNATSLIGLTILGRSVILPMGVMILFAILGAVDDWAGLRGRPGSKGLRARTKFIIQWIIALIFSLIAILLSVLVAREIYDGLRDKGIKVSSHMRYTYFFVKGIIEKDSETILSELAEL